MKNCRFSSLARQDLRGIHDYFAQDDPAAALRLVGRIEEATELLKDNPYLGESCEELAERVRMIIVGNYVIFYRPVDDGVEIARVIHGARDWRRLF